MHVTISTSDAIVIHDCIDRFMGSRRGRKPAALVRLRDDLANAVSTEEIDLATYGICDPAGDITCWVPPSIVELVWDCLNIYAYDAGPCPCGDDTGSCIIQRWFDFVWYPTVTLPTVHPDYVKGGQYANV